ncbi:MAG: ABC transporter permease subunit [Xanthobacteraceae bacterium]|nr:ABC transporter permease subunit [Xanthobacteraceae bacterium]
MDGELSGSLWSTRDEIFYHLWITSVETVLGFVIGASLALVCGLWFALSVREVSPVVLAKARMLGASRGQLLRTVYLPSATSWVFSSLHTSVGMAFVGAVVGEYLGSSAGFGYLILQAEGVFDVNTVFAAIVVLTMAALLLNAIIGIVERRKVHSRNAIPLQ